MKEISIIRFVFLCACSLLSFECLASGKPSAMDLESLQQNPRVTHHTESINVGSGEKKEMTAAEKMQHNANREAMMKNWKINFSYDPNSYSGKYVHSSGARALYVRLLGKYVEENKPGTTSLELTKTLIGKFKADLDTLKIYSPEMSGFDVQIDRNRPLNAENMIRVFVRKDDVNDAATIIHVIGSVSQDDLNYVVEDFFLKIESVMSGKNAVTDDSSDRNNDRKKDQNAGSSGTGEVKSSDRSSIEQNKGGANSDPGAAR